MRKHILNCLSAIKAIAATAIVINFFPVTVLAQNPDSRAKAAKPLTDAQKQTFFERQVKPILKAKCVKCHGGESKIRGGLRLTNRANLLKGGETGPAVSLKKPAESLLIDAINYRDLEMPPTTNFQTSKSIPSPAG